MHFKDTDVPIWVHKLELESAFYCCATGADDAVYQAHYLLPKAFNWKTFDDRTVDFAPGLTLHHLPGHTTGLCGLQVNLINDGTFIFVSECVQRRAPCCAPADALAPSQPRPRQGASAARCHTRSPLTHLPIRRTSGLAFLRAGWRAITRL